MLARKLLEKDRSNSKLYDNTIIIGSFRRCRIIYQKFKMRTFSVRAMYFFDIKYAITSGVLVFGQADHHREWCVRDSHIIIFSLYSADAFLKQSIQYQSTMK